MTLFNELNAQSSILRTALTGVAKRHSVISNNITNADVPGFVAGRVEFESALADATANYPRNRNVDVSGVVPTVHFQNPNFRHRIDGNNVDIETEMVNLYQNSMRFDTIVSSITANSQRMRTILQQ
ncbi:MAG: flagellar basal body rod protein FlgB [Defluviitaleaceae bacterium]|nr:flagellar basal body rod protein FlgB [Defluviitaleaceae bacterium]